MNITFSESLNNLAKQFVKFGIVGLSNTAIAYLIIVVTLLCLSPLKLSYDFYVANVVSFILSVAWSYYWNRRYVFNISKKFSIKSEFYMLLKTYASYFFTGIVLTNIGSYVFIVLFDIDKYIAPFFNLLFTVPLNFLLIKFFALK